MKIGSPPPLRHEHARAAPAGTLRGLLAVVLLCLVQDAYALKIEVRVAGLEGEWEKNVLALLAIYRERDDKTLTEPQLYALHRRAPGQIREALAPFGLYRVEVDDSLTPPVQVEGTWVASYRVVPGDPVKVASVDYRIVGDGADNAAFPKAFPMQPGDVLLHANYDKAKEEIRSVAAEQGYLNAELVEHRVLVDLETYAAKIEFHLDTGPRYYLGEVRFEQDLLDDEFLHEFVRFKPGDVYDPERLLRLQGRLLGTEYFSKVELVPRKEEAGEDRVIPIDAIATPNKANKFRFGLGYSTDTGPRVTLDWRRRYLTRWGHKLRTELSISEAIQGFEADYRIPIGNPIRDYISIKPVLNAYNTASRQGDIYTLQVAHSAVTPWGWRRTAGVDYRYEDYAIGESDRQSVNELVPNISWSLTDTDDPIFTTDGYRLKFSLLGAVENIVSPASYLQWVASAKWIRSFAEDYRFIARADLGATWADTLFDLPSSRRFFTGGDNSIRGWPFDALGPEDPATGETLGGRFLAVGSAELERRIQGNWSGAIFTDFGNAFDPDYDQELAVGGGAGLRWRSPIGQVRVDVAFKLNEPDFPARLVLVIGPDL